MKFKLSILFAVLLLMTCLSGLYAVRATPNPVKITQKDGSEITIHLHGNEFFHYKTTLDGYLLTTDSAGILNYAEIDKKGNLLNTRVKARNIEKRSLLERDLLKRLSPNVNFKNTFKLQKKLHSNRIVSSATIRKNYPLIGSPKSLVILVNFKDVSFKIASPKTAFTNLLNQAGYSANGGTGSARDYFFDNSMGVFNPTFDVVGPFNLPDSLSYYGKNVGENDSNPQQMVIDACTLAANSGVNFSQYDTDNDGYIDNIFVYYAGYNEAEGAPSNTVWPHRWSLNNSNTKFNGKIIYDYACTSELKGNSGINMCGIGTFVHEFGHVLGLLDYYPTDGASHQTLSYWSVMDEGPYLNQGRTPPSYSAYDRFSLDWIKPTELKSGGIFSLENLSTSNKAYLITQYGNHNLNGTNPSPVEFFTLENRQKSGWDSYLPGHGMLITRIYYNPITWNDNSPNNDPNAMGVDLIEADGLASNGNLGGDPFPGTKFVNSYTPTLRSGEEISNKELTIITETNGLITFQFMSGDALRMKSPIAKDAIDVTTGSFISNWTNVNPANGYYLTVYNISNGTSVQTEGFDKGEATPNGWKITTKKRTSSKLYSGKNVPAVQFSNSSDTIITEEYILPVTKLTFFIRSLAGLNGLVRIEGKNDLSWSKIDSIPVDDGLQYQTKSYEFEISKNYTQFRITYKKGTGDVAIDDITVHFNQNLEFNKHEVWTTANSDTLMNLITNREYFYKVRASKKLLNSDQSILFENISDFSNTIRVTTLENKPGNILRVQKDGSIQMLIPTDNLTIRVYNTLGQLIRKIVNETNIFKIEGLVKGQVYVVEAGEFRTKIIL
ncbi:MAG: M6 family metalloprotease domain-containing protein [Paludibacter sp.]|nr:M6 family metalloprotease domain-containing protein [Paludibacter sp.]